MNSLSPAARAYVLLLPFVLLSLLPTALLLSKKSIFLDFAVICLLLLAASSHRLLLPLLFAPVLLRLVQLVAYLFTGNLIDIYTLMTLTATNLEEGSGFLELVLSTFPAPVGLYLLAVPLAAVGVFRAKPFPVSALWRSACISTVLFIGLFYYKHGDTVSSQDLSEHSFYGRVASIVGNFYTSFVAGSYEQSPIATLEKTDSSAADSVLVVLGESATTYRMGAYGYHRNTTPHLTKADVLFRDLVSVGLNTQPNIQALLTGEVGVVRLHHEQDVFRAAKQAGFTSYYVDNNRFVNWDPMYQIARQSESYYSLNGIGETIARNDHKIRHDELVFKPFQHMLSASQGKKRVIYVHLVGSHFNHDLRYPDSFHQFPSHYDNSILYTDHIVEELRKTFMASSQGQRALMVYVADHGVKIPPGCGLGDVPENENANYGNDERHYSNLSVPLAFWFNPEFSTQNGQMVDALRASQSKPIDQRFLFWTLADVMGIKRVNGRPVSDFSLFSLSASYLPRKNSRGEDIDDLVARGQICKH